MKADPHHADLVQKATASLNHEVFIHPANRFDLLTATRTWSALDLFGSFLSARKEELRQRIFSLLSTTPPTTKGHNEAALDDGSQVKREMRGGKERPFSAELTQTVLEEKGIMEKGCSPHFTWLEATTWQAVPEADKAVILRYFGMLLIPDFEKVKALAVAGVLSTDDAKRCTTPPKPPVVALIVTKAPDVISAWQAFEKEIENAREIETSNNRATEELLEEVLPSQR